MYIQRPYDFTFYVLIFFFFFITYGFLNSPYDHLYPIGSHSML